MTELQLERLDTLEKCINVSIDQMVHAVIEGDKEYISTLNNNITMWIRELSEFKGE